MDYKLKYNMKKSDFLNEQRVRNEIFDKIASFIGEKEVCDILVQEQVGRLFNWLNEFYDCSISMFKGLSEMYSYDSDFIDIIKQNYGVEMPDYLAKAMICFCNNSN